MAFEIREREREGIVILDLTGRLVLGDASTSLRDTAARVQASGRSRIVLNLAGVEFIDSTGLGAMVIVATSAKKAGGAVKLASLNQRGLELMVMTKLTTVFEIFPDDLAAINSFFPDRKIEHFDILEFVRAERQKQEKTDPT
jgi:anti-sigma B factor antagonist